MGSPPMGAPNAGGENKVGHIRRMTRYTGNSITVQERRIVSIKVDRKSYTLDGMVMLRMTLGDP